MFGIIAANKIKKPLSEILMGGITNFHFIPEDLKNVKLFILINS